MHPLKLVFSFLCVCSVRALKPDKLKNLDEAKCKEIIQCYWTIMCDERKPLEFLRLLETAKDSEEVRKDAMNIVDTSCNVKVEPTEDFYLTMPDLICGTSSLERISQSVDFGAMLTDYYEKHDCDQEEVSEQNSEYCSDFNKLIEAGFGLLDKYTEMKVCGDPERVATAMKNSGQTIGNPLG